MHPIRFRQMPLDPARFHILFALAKCGPATIAQVEQQITADALGSVYIKTSTFYALIHSLSERQLIKPTDSDASSYLRDYQLTTKGRQLLVHEIAYYEQVAQLARRRRDTSQS